MVKAAVTHIDPGEFLVTEIFKLPQIADLARQQRLGGLERRASQGHRVLIFRIFVDVIVVGSGREKTSNSSGL